MVPPLQSNKNSQSHVIEEKDEEGRIPTYVWDSIDIDLFIKVARLSILSPFFSMWVPVMILGQGFDSTSTPFKFTLYYFLTTLLLSLLSSSSRIYENQSHLFGLQGLFGSRKTDWGEEVVVITGGRNGLGRSLVEIFGIRGVGVCVLDVEDGEEGEWDDVYYYKCDVSDKAQVMEAAEKIRKDVGEPTILINNAGVIKGKHLLDLSENDIKSTIGVNLLAHFWTIQAFLPAMIRNKKGHIVTVGSVLGDVGIPQLSDYCASKAALNALHESVKYEIKTRYPAASPHIHLTLLRPGHIRTRLFSHLRRPSALGSFLSPIQEPHNVAKEVIMALDGMESREINLPWYCNWTWVLRGLPSWGKELARKLARADEAMLDYYQPNENSEHSSLAKSSSTSTSTSTFTKDTTGRTTGVSVSGSDKKIE